MAEIWRDISGYDGKYQVSNLGRVKSFHKGGRILKPQPDKDGYLCTRLCRDGKHKGCKIHRLVAQAFIPNPDGKSEVNHIDGDKANNRAENLEWVTPSENSRHAVATGLQRQGEDCSWAKFTNEQIRFIRDNPDGLNTCELARLFNVCDGTIGRIQCGKQYRDAGGMIRKAKPKTPRIPDEVREQIRAEHQPHKHGYGTTVLSKKYGVCPQTILNIINEK